MKQRISAWLMRFQMEFGVGGPPLSRVTPEEWARKVQQGKSFGLVPKDKQTEEVCLAAVQFCAWTAMRVLLTREQRTPAVTLAALQIDGRLISCLTPEERTPEVCLAAVLQNDSVLEQLTPEEFTHDLALAAVNKSGSAILSLNDRQRTREVCIATVQLYGWNIQYLTPEQRTPEVCLAAVQEFGSAIEYLTDEQRTPEVCLASLEQQPKAIRHLSPENCAQPQVASWITANWDQCASILGGERAAEVAQAILHAREQADEPQQQERSEDRSSAQRG